MAMFVLAQVFLIMLITRPLSLTAKILYGKFPLEISEAYSQVRLSVIDNQI